MVFKGLTRSRLIDVTWIQKPLIQLIWWWMHRVSMVELKVCGNTHICHLKAMDSGGYWFWVSAHNPWCPLAVERVLSDQSVYFTNPKRNVRFNTEKYYLKVRNMKTHNLPSPLKPPGNHCLYSEGALTFSKSGLCALQDLGSTDPGGKNPDSSGLP